MFLKDRIELNIKNYQFVIKNYLYYHITLSMSMICLEGCFQKKIVEKYQTQLFMMSVHEIDKISEIEDNARA